MCLLAQEMGFTEPWLQQNAQQVIAEIFAATAATNPALEGMTLERLQKEGFVSLQVEPKIPFAGGRFPTPSGKMALFSQNMADQGLDPLPGWVAREDDGLACRQRAVSQRMRRCS